MSSNNLIRSGSRYPYAFLTGIFVIALTLSPNAMAQAPESANRNVDATATQPLPAAKENVARQNISASLVNLPEADSLFYISPHRILIDAAPRVLPEKDLAQMRQGLSELKKRGVDPSTIDYVVLQVRFKKPTADLSFSLPELSTYCCRTKYSG